MKTQIFVLLFACSLFSYAQVKIGNDVSTIDQFSILELESNSKALVLTRVTNAQMQSMQPLMGALVYNIDSECIHFFDGSTWSNLCEVEGNNTSSISLIDNENGTFTFNGGNNTELTFYGGPERITTLTDNLNGTFTYVNENDVETTITFPTDGFSGSFIDLTDIPADLDTDSTDDFSGNFVDLTGVPANLDLDSTDDFSGNFIDLANVPVNLDTDSTDDFSGSFNDLTNVPTDLSDGDDNTTYSAGNGLDLSGTEFSINNAQLAPDFPNLTNVPVNLDTDSTDDFSGDFADLTNLPVNLDTDSTDDFSGNFVDLTGVPANLDLDSTDDFSGDFADLSNVPANLDTDAADDFSGDFADLTNVPANLDTDATDDFSGSFNDLTNVPANLDLDTADDFSGNFADLAGVPANLDVDSTDDFSGNFADLTNVPVNLDTDSTDDFSGNFNDLIDVPTDLSDGDDNTTYSAGNGLDLSGTEFSINNAQLAPDFANLTNVPVNLDTDATDDFSGSFNDLTDIPANLDTDSTDDFSGDFADLTNLPVNLDTDSTDDFSGSFNDLTNVPTNLDLDTTDDFSGNFADLAGVPANLDVDSTDDFSGDFADLTNVPVNLDTDSTDDFSGDFSDLTNVPANLDTDSTDDFSGSFTDLTNIPANLDIDSTDDFSGSFNDLTNLPANLDTDSTDDFSGDFADLTNVPTNLDTDSTDDFSGDFGDLANVPVNLDTDATDDFSGDFGDLTNVPSNLDIDSTDDFSGSYNDLTDVPSIQGIYDNDGSLSSNRVLNGDGNGLDFTNMNGGLNIAGATTGTGNVNTTDGALLHIKQESLWSGLTPWALYVEGYTNLNGFRINGADNPRGIFTEGNQLGFAIKDDKLITFTQNNNDTRLSILPGGILQFHEYGGGTITGTETQLLGVESDGRVVEVDLGDIGGVTGTEGSIFYADTDGNATENNDDFFWDATNGRLGIGTNSPSHSLQVIGQVRAYSSSNANGTVNNPSYRFNQDADTGMFRAAANQLGLGTGGTEAVRIDASQNVGIKTTTPNSTLHSNGSLAVAILKTTGSLTLNDTHHTIVLGGDHSITLPSAPTSTGRMYIIKNPTGSAVSTSNYLDEGGSAENEVKSSSIIWLQSDGSDWQLINNITTSTGGGTNGGGVTGTPTNNMVADFMDDGQNGTANNFTLNIRNTTGTAIDYEVLIENAPYATIPGLVLTNHTYQVVDNGNSTYNHIFTSISSLGGFTSRTIAGGNNVQPPGSGLSCGCVSFYEL